MERERMRRLNKKLVKVERKLLSVKEQLTAIDRTRPDENCYPGTRDPQQNHTFWRLWPKRQTYVCIRAMILTQIHELEK